MTPTPSVAASAVSHSASPRATTSEPRDEAVRFANLPAWAWLLALACLAPFLAAYLSAAGQ